MDAADALRVLGGVASSRRLRAEGVDAAALRRACGDGRVQRLRIGWYALPRADPDVVAAVRAGGALDCWSVLEKASVWVPMRGTRHIAIPRHARGAPSGWVVHWVAAGSSIETPVVALPSAIAHAMRCATAEQRVAIVESALRRQLTSRSMLAIAGVPRTVLAKCGGSSESGAESLVRQRLLGRRISFRQQVEIPGVGRVDFLIGDRLVLEVDGYAHHGDRDAFERDRRRDAALLELGYVVLRVSARQVEEERDRIDRVLLALIRARRHRWPRRRGVVRPHADQDAGGARMDSAARAGGAPEPVPRTSRAGARCRRDERGRGA